MEDSPLSDHRGRQTQGNSLREFQLGRIYSLSTERSWERCEECKTGIRKLPDYLRHPVLSFQDLWAESIMVVESGLQAARRQKFKKDWRGNPKWRGLELLLTRNFKRKSPKMSHITMVEAKYLYVSRERI